jgi:hypothetical protein
MANRQIKVNKTCLDEAVADGIGTPINVSDYRHVILQLGTTDSAAAVVKFQGSSSDDAPTFSATQTPTNHWDYIGVYDYEPADIIEGDTGITLSGADDTRTLMVNSDGIDWINAIVSSWSAGKITVKVKGFNNI